LPHLLLLQLLQTVLRLPLTVLLQHLLSPPAAAAVQLA
jgi:hypothetical protein